MKLSEFISRVKLAVPNTNQIGISNEYITTLLNTGCDKANLLAKVYKGYTDFNIVAEQRLYDFATYVPTYLGTAKKGLFFKDTNDKWQDIIPKTEAWLSETYPDYLNSTSSGIPQWYYIEPTEVGFHPPPSTSKDKGARLYHLKKANPMSGDDDYPYSGDATEITALEPLDDCIIAYCVWKLAPSFGVVQDIDLRYREFILECKNSAKQIKRRRDLTADSCYRMRLSI